MFNLFVEGIARAGTDLPVRQGESRPPRVGNTKLICSFTHQKGSSRRQTQMTTLPARDVPGGGNHRNRLVLSEMGGEEGIGTDC